MTYSIVARNPDTGEFGVATATGLLAVGALVPHAWAGLGAIATQGFSTNPLYVEQARGRLAGGETAQHVVARLVEADPGRDCRQVLVVDRRGGTAAWSGAGNTPAQSHLCQENLAVGGNTLTDHDVVDSMAEAYHAAAAVSFPQRLMAAMDAAERHGGDSRRTRSAALYIVHTEAYATVDLRVDDHRAPIAELARLFRLSMAPDIRGFMARLPTRGDPGKS